MEASSEYNLWTEDEISNDDNFDVIDYSPSSTGTESNVSISEFEVQDFFSETSVDDDVDSIPDLATVSDSTEDSILEAIEEVNEEALDLGEEPRTSTFAAACSCARGFCFSHNQN